MPPLNQVVTPPNIPLNTDFGHAPLGKLGNRAVQIGETTAPRAKSAGETVKNFFSRIANALTPSSVRVESKFRQDLRDFSSKLSSTLGKISTTDMSTPRGKEKVQAALQELRTAARSLENRGANYDTLIQSQFDMKFSRMTPDEQLAVKIGLSNASQNGIDLKGVRLLSGSITPEAQTMSEAPLEGARSARERLEHMWPDGTPSGVSEGFYKDMWRFPMSIDGVPLLDKRNDTRGEEEQMKEGIAKLREFVGDDQRLFNMSTYAHQGLFSGLQMAQVTGKGPIMLPDGRSGYLQGEKTTTHYEFTKGTGEDINLHLSQNIQGRTFNIGAEAPLPVDPVLSKSMFQMDFVFSPGATPRMEGPVTFEYQAKLDTAWGNPDFTRPIDFQDLMDRDRDGPLQDAFRAKCEARFVTENLDFMQEFRALGPDTTLGQVREMAQKYIGPTSTNEVNLDEALANHILTTIGRMTPETFDVNAVRELLQPANDSLHTFMEGGPFREFLLENQV